MKCEDCRFWSEMCAASIGCGPIEALCLNEKSPYQGKMIVGHTTCSFGLSGYLGAVDAPGNDGAYDQERSEMLKGTDKITVCDKCLQASCWHGEFM